jgi:TonB family protein
MAEEAIRAALWFHPAMWVLVSRIQSTREEVVDELSVLLTVSRRSYVDALVAFVDRPPVFAAAAFARRRHLVRRIVLISKERAMSSRRLVASGAVLTAAVLFTGWYSVQAFPLTETVQMPRDPVKPPPPPPAPAKVVVSEEALQKAVQADPSAANYMRLAVFYFEKAFRDKTLSPPEKSTFMTLGVQATDGALAQNPEYVDALIYKNILLRMQANEAADPAEQKRLIGEADDLRSRAIELQKKYPRANELRGSVPGVPPPPPPPPPPPAPDALGDQDGDAPVRVGGNVKAPAKIKNVFPVYPEDARNARVQGVVIVEALIGADGLVRDAHVLRSIPMLDQAALDAVMQWEFAPTYLNGVAKSIILTVTVSFTLQ